MYQVEKNPTAHITVNKGRRKIKKGKFVYLNDGQEFELELFNPTQDTILCKIWINNKPISSSGIVLRPGERVFLERFIDDPAKFKFDTYEVGGNSEAVKRAIEKNGLVRVEFYREDVTTTITYTTPNISWDLNGTHYQDYTYIDYNAGTTTPLSNVSTTFTTNSVASFGDIQKRSLKSKSAKGHKKMETGRVEKGSHSQQNFTKVDKKFYYSSFHNIEYQIKPMSVMKIDAKQAVQTTKYCTSCGKKAKHTHKFCSSCGTKL